MEKLKKTVWKNWLQPLPAIRIFSALYLAKNISVDKTYIFGPLLVLERLFQNSGIDKVLSIIAEKHPKLGFDLHRLVFTMAAARFIKPGSKLKVFEHWQKQLYPGNTFEGAIVCDIVKKLRQKFKVRRFIFVGDRGLFSRKNLQALQTYQR